MEFTQLRDTLSANVTAGGDDQVSSLLVCAVLGGLQRYGPMSADLMARRHGLDVLLVVRALDALRGNNEVRWSRENNGWESTYR